MSSSPRRPSTATHSLEVGDENNKPSKAHRKSLSSLTFTRLPKKTALSFSIAAPSPKSVDTLDNEENEEPVLILKTFQKIPYVNFNKIFLGESKSKNLIVHNPAHVPQSITAIRVPDAKTGFELSEMILYLLPGQKLPLTINWHPQTASKYREKIYFINSFNEKFEVILLANAVVKPQAKKRTRPLWSAHKPKVPVDVLKERENKQTQTSPNLAQNLFKKKESEYKEKSCTPQPCSKLETAALKIQRAWRTHRFRQNLNKPKNLNEIIFSPPRKLRRTLTPESETLKLLSDINQAAIIIQKAFKKYIAIRNAKNEAAALTIQKSWKSYKSKKTTASSTFNETYQISTSKILQNNDNVSINQTVVLGSCKYTALAEASINNKKEDHGQSKEIIVSKSEEKLSSHFYFFDPLNNLTQDSLAHSYSTHLSNFSQCEMDLVDFHHFHQESISNLQSESFLSQPSDSTKKAEVIESNQVNSFNKFENINKTFELMDVDVSQQRLENAKIIDKIEVSVNEKNDGQNENVQQDITVIEEIRPQVVPIAEQIIINEKDTKMEEAEPSKIVEVVRKEVFEVIDHAEYIEEKTKDKMIEYQSSEHEEVQDNPIDLRTDDNQKKVVFQCEEKKEIVIEDKDKLTNVVSADIHVELQIIKGEKSEVCVNVVNLETKQNKEDKNEKENKEEKERLNEADKLSETLKGEEKLEFQTEKEIEECIIYNQFEVIESQTGESDKCDEIIETKIFEAGKETQSEEEASESNEELKTNKINNTEIHDSAFEVEAKSVEKIEEDKVNKISEKEETIDLVDEISSSIDALQKPEAVPGKGIQKDDMVDEVEDKNHNKIVKEEVGQTLHKEESVDSNEDTSNSEESAQEVVPDNEFEIHDSSFEAEAQQVRKVEEEKVTLLTEQEESLNLKEKITISIETALEGVTDKEIEKHDTLEVEAEQTKPAEENEKVNQIFEKEERSDLRDGISNLFEEVEQESLHEGLLDKELENRKTAYNFETEFAQEAEEEEKLVSEIKGVDLVDDISNQVEVQQETQQNVGLDNQLDNFVIITKQAEKAKEEKVSKSAEKEEISSLVEAVEEVLDNELEKHESDLEVEAEPAESAELNEEETVTLPTEQEASLDLKNEITSSIKTVQEDVADKEIENYNTASKLETNLSPKVDGLKEVSQGAGKEKIIDSDIQINKSQEAVQEIVPEFEKIDSTFELVTEQAEKVDKEKVSETAEKEEMSSAVEAVQEETYGNELEKLDTVMEAKAAEGGEKVNQKTDQESRVDLEEEISSLNEAKPVQETVQETLLVEEFEIQDSTFVIEVESVEKVEVVKGSEIAKKDETAELEKEISSSVEAVQEPIQEETQETVLVEELEKQDATFIIDYKQAENFEEEADTIEKEKTGMLEEKLSSLLETVQEPVDEPDQIEKEETVDLENVVNDSTEATQKVQDLELEINESKVKNEEFLNVIEDEDVAKEKDWDQDQESFAIEGVSQVKFSEPQLDASQNFEHIETKFDSFETHEELPQHIEEEVHFDNSEVKVLGEAKEDQKIELQLNESASTDNLDERQKPEAITSQSDTKSSGITVSICENTSSTEECFESFSDSLELLEVTSDTFTFSSTIQTPNVSSIKLSESAEKVLKESELVKSCIVIQKYARGYLTRKKFKAAVKAAILIQKTWRGYKIRKHHLQDDCFEQIFQKVKLSNDNATEEMTLGKRTSNAFHRLIHFKHFTQLTCEVKSLELTTRLSPESCLTIASENTIKTLEDIISKSNRSEPNKLIIYYSFGILINLIKYEKTAVFVQNRTSLIETCLKFAKIHYRFEKILNRCLTLLYILIDTNPNKEKIINDPNIKLNWERFLKLDKLNLSKPSKPFKNIKFYPEWYIANNVDYQFTQENRAIYAVSSLLKMRAKKVTK